VVVQDGPRALRLLIVDDHAVVREGLRSMVEEEADVEVVGVAATVADAVRMARDATPDVVLMDVRLPDGSGVDALRRIHADRPEVAVLVLTASSDDRTLFDAILAGASGYLLKDVAAADLLAGIRRVAAGESLLDPSVTARVLQRVREGGTERDGGLNRLSPTERRILDAIAEGQTNRQIGRQLGLAEKTIKNYVSGILAKLGVGGRTEAAAYLVEHREP
jgi:two-component system, NarL family, response regulator DevR